MTVMSDIWIRQMALEHGMITPFVEAQKREGVISYGLSSYGYDARAACEWKVFHNTHSVILDPKNIDELAFHSHTDPVCIIPPNSFALTRTIEHFSVPRDVLVSCIGKSTYARVGISINVTPIEPEWRGYVTIEISNATPLPAMIYGNEGICQFLFFKGDQPCEVSYADRKGKYQDQAAEIVLPKL